METVTLEIEWGGLISDGIKRGIKTAKSLNCQVDFNHSTNGVYVILGPDSEFDLVMRDYERAQKGCIRGNTIGPHYEKELSPETIARETEYINKRAEALEIEAKAENQLLRAKEMRARAWLDFIQPSEMTFLDVNAEKKFREVADANSDSYGSAIIRMANDLARLLEFRLGPDKRITKSLVRECEETIFGDLYGASGFQANTAENIISQLWIHGAAFYPFTVHARIEDECSLS